MTDFTNLYVIHMDQNFVFKLSFLVWEIVHTTIFLVTNIHV